MFKRAASQLSFMPKDGESVEVFGKLGVYESRGELQLVVESMRRAGQGTLFEEFLKLKAQLESEGLFDASLKRDINPMPRRIGVVTSLNAAALHDVCTALKRRVPHIPVVICAAIVQGAEAPQSLVKALNDLYTQSDVDVILLVRGGGSIEDLWGFNSERLARVIKQSPVPIITGVGHETDFTIADFCADLRAPTPTAAAELCATPTRELLERLQAANEWLSRQLEQRLDTESQRLDYLHQRMGRPSQWLQQQHMVLARAHTRMREGIRRPLDQANGLEQIVSLKLANALRRAQQIRNEQLSRAKIRLELLDPSLVLERGYAWLSNQSGDAITQASQLSVDQQVHAVMKDGQASLKVISKTLN
jgi:exodeoxyribonuclease VII large subunit